MEANSGAMPQKGNLIRMSFSSFHVSAGTALESARSIQPPPLTVPAWVHFNALSRDSNLHPQPTTPLSVYSLSLHVARSLPPRGNPS